MPEVIAAVEGAVAWFEAAKITGIRLKERGSERVLVEDSGAPPLWARFYDLKTGQPFFCDRDGVPKSTIAEIGSERRDGYAW
jgi:PelA/Pel-15E family pectate lyase